MFAARRPEKVLMVSGFEKTSVPEKVLAFARSVEEAAVMVMLPVPSKETPLMVRGVWRAVAVPALPLMDPVMVEEKVLLPEKVLELARSVEEAAVMVIGEAPVKVTPLMVLPGESAEAVAALPPMESEVVLTKVFCPFRNARMVPGV